MKKKIIIMGLMLMTVILSQAQIRVYNLATNQAVANSPAFVDASSNVLANSSSNLGKGLIFPRVDLSTFTLPQINGRYGSTANFPTYLDGMIVYNTNTGGTAAVGSTEGTLTRGFWYYENTTNSETGGIWKPLGSGSGGGPGDGGACSEPPTGASIIGFTGAYNLNAEFTVSCYAAVTGTAVYTWTVNTAGLEIVSGQGTNLLVLRGIAGGTYAGTLIECTVSNGCGDLTVHSATSAIVNDCETVPAAPATLTLSPTSIKVGEKTVATCGAVPGATSYVWTLPAGLSAANNVTTTNSIEITAAAVGTYGQGSITVSSRNSCGESVTSTGSTNSLAVAESGPGSSLVGTTNSCFYISKENCVCAKGTVVGYDNATPAQRQAAQTAFTAGGNKWWRTTISFTNGYAYFGGTDWYSGSDSADAKRFACF